jgi:CAAX prenyl protease-like protein
MDSSSPVFLLLLLYPAVGFVSPFAFHSLWPEELPRVPISSDGDEDKRTSATRGALVSLFVYTALLCSTIVYRLLFPLSLDNVGLPSNSRVWTTLVGAYLGISWAGVSIWLLALGAVTGRMRREISGLMAPLRVQIPVWLMEAIAEEAWRVVAILGLVAAHNSPAFSVAATAIAFGSAYLRFGLQRAAVAILDGLFFGFLFLWQGSLLAPLTAHLAVHAVYLWGVGQYSQDRESRKTWQIPGTTCPVCRADLKLLQVKMSDVLECPSCKASLSVSDGYQNVLRFTAAFSFCSLIVITILLLKDWVPSNLVVWLTYPVSYGVATSGIFLYRRLFTRLFPPRLQRGTPNFITLNLEGRRESKVRDSEDNAT